MAFTRSVNVKSFLINWIHLISIHVYSSVVTSTAEYMLIGTMALTVDGRTREVLGGS